MPATPPVPTTLELRLAAAKARGWAATCLDPETNWLWRLSRGERQIVLFGSQSPLNSATGARLASDKDHTATILRGAGLPAIEGARCLKAGVHLGPAGGEAGDPYADQRGLAPGLRFAEASGYPVVVKPNRGSRGRAVTVVEDADQLREAVEAVWAMDNLALVQRAVPGVDLRIDMLDGELLLAYLRRPLRLVGDGRSTVLELLGRADARAKDAEFIARTTGDPLWAATLAAQGLDDNGVPAPGQTLAFPATILNLNRCCTATVYGELPEPWIELARRVGAAMGMRHWGIDLRIPDGDDPVHDDPDPSQAVILEVNASPVMIQVYRMGAASLVESCEGRLTDAILELAR